MKEGGRKAFLAAIGTVFKVKEVANITAGKFENMVKALVKEGEMNEPKAREFARKSVEMLHEKAKEAQDILEKRAKNLQAAALREVNRLAKDVAKATAPPRKPKKK